MYTVEGRRSVALALWGSCGLVSNQADMISVVTGVTCDLTGATSDLTGVTSDLTGVASDLTGATSVVMLPRQFLHLG
ncbi:MAG: hypothetical protein KME50_02105 [Nostoc desertorum CM1-VF14]|nr:hypothetical protein [Nostoc desertorum CM1-VF14]